MPLVPASEREQLIGTESSGSIGTFAERAQEFANAAHDARLGGTQIDAVWVVCKHASPSWAARSSWLDRMAAQQYCGNIVHIELVFCNTSTQVRIAYTVDKADAKYPGSGFVRMVTPDPSHTYPAPAWTCHRLASLTPAEIYGLMAFCQRQVGKPFNYNMYWHFAPLIGALVAGEPCVEEPHYFCSQLIASALRWIRPRTHAALNPRRCTPAMLHELLSHDSDGRTVMFRPAAALAL